MSEAPAPRTHRPSASAGRRVARIVGVLLLVAGLGILGYLGWEYYGTNIVAKRAQERVTAELHQSWAAGAEGGADGLLRVPRFGSDFEVPINESFSRKALSSGVGRFEDGARPGEVGNVVLSGHRVTHGEPFRDFPKLRKGDEVEIETRTRIYVYALRADGDELTVDFSTDWVLLPDPLARSRHATRRMLTLVTCSELFHTRNRSVVFADLVATRDKGSP